MALFWKFDTATNKLYIRSYNDSEASYTEYTGGGTICPVTYQPLITTITVEDNVTLPANCSGMFSNCTSLLSADLRKFNTSNVTDMSRMFSNCPVLNSLNVSSFDTHNVTTLERMFYGCQALNTLNLSSFNTSNVTNMSYMFSGCDTLTSINKNFNTSKVTTMAYMFNDCTGLADPGVTNFDMSKVTNVSNMFADCNSTMALDLTNWDTSKFTNTTNLFSGCGTLASIKISKLWDLSNTSLTNSAGMFTGCANLPNFSAAWTDKRTAYADDGTIHGAIGTSGGYFTADVKMYVKRSGTTVQIKGQPDTENGFTEYTGGYIAGSLANNNNLTSYEIISKCIAPSSMSNLFNGANKITSFALDTIDVTNTTNLSGAFKNCTSATKIKLNNWNIANVTNTNGMFANDSNLTNVLATEGQWNVDNVVDSIDMFTNCNSIMNWNGSTNKTMAHIAYTVTTEGIKKYTEYIGEGTGLYWNKSEWADHSKWTVDWYGISQQKHMNLKLRGTPAPGYVQYLGNGPITGVLHGAASTSWGICNDWVGDIKVLEPCTFPENCSQMFEACCSLFGRSRPAPTPGDADTYWISGIAAAFDFSLVDMSFVKNANRMFAECQCANSYTWSGKYGDMQPTTADYMFFNNYEFLGKIDTSKLDTSKLTSTNGMFYNCKCVAEFVWGENFTMKNVKNATDMFNGCSTVPELSLIGENWDVTGLTNATRMFANMGALAHIWGSVGYWDPSAVTSAAGMFTGDTLLHNFTATGGVTDGTYRFIDNGYNNCYVQVRCGLVVTPVGAGLCDGGGEYGTGDKVTLVATPGDKSNFKGWYIDERCRTPLPGYPYEDNPLVFTMPLVATYYIYGRFQSEFGGRGYVICQASEPNPF